MLEKEGLKYSTTISVVFCEREFVKYCDRTWQLYPRPGTEFPENFQQIL